MGIVSTKSYEDLLGDALEAITAGGASTLEEFVEGLNRLNLRGPLAQTWTAELLRRELERLGA